MAEPNLNRETSLNREYRSYDQFGDEPLSVARAQEAVVRPIESARETSADEWVLPSTELAAKAGRALQIAFVAVFMAAGIDKFANQLTDWSQYIASAIPRFFAMTPQSFLYLVGIWEISLAIGIALRPRVFADIAAIWLVAIVINLLMQGQHFDIALRDFGLAAGACALARLSQARERSIRS